MEKELWREEVGEEGRERRQSERESITDMKQDRVYTIEKQRRRRPR